MKKKNWIGYLLIVLIVSACNFPGEKQTPADVDAGLVATAVQLTLAADQQNTDQPDENEATTVVEPTVTQQPATATLKPVATATLTKTPLPTETPLPTATLSNDDPATVLGNASWTAEFNADKEGFYDGDDEHTVIEVQNNTLSFTSTLAIIGWHTWSLNFRTVENAYYEAEMNIKQCSGADEYGLMFRAPDYYSGYFFAVRCNGEYSLRTYDGEYEFIAGWQYSDRVKAGANQSNRLGVRMDGNELKLYINGELVATIIDDTFTDVGHFGFFTAAYVTPGFRVEVDRARYWNLN